MSYGVEVRWTNSLTSKSAEPGEVILPASVTDGQPIKSRTTTPTETYMFEYWDGAVTFGEHVRAAAPRQPLMRDGKQVHYKGDLLWWIATASVSNPPDGPVLSWEPNEFEQASPTPEPEYSGPCDGNGDPLV
jgi:hypothetical protein